MRRKKRILRLIATGVIILIICTLVCSFFVLPKEKGKFDYTLSFGDTPWELYEEWGSGIKWGKWYDKMLSENGKAYGEEWYAGEEITLLIYK